jgi:hypothetical protein
VKLVRNSTEELVFELGAREKDLLLSVLNLYPRIPSARQPLRRSQSLPSGQSSQRLLDEALAEQRKQNQQQVQTLLKDPKRLSQHEDAWRLSLSPGEMEWLLQILNDVRIGSWVLLGSPEARLEKVNLETAPHLWAMEMAGSFQMYFLNMLERGRGRVASDE